MSNQTAQLPTVHTEINSMSPEIQEINSRLKASKTNQEREMVFADLKKTPHLFQAWLRIHGNNRTYPMAQQGVPQMSIPQYHQQMQQQAAYIRQAENKYDLECKAHLQTKSQLSNVQKDLAEALSKIEELSDNLKSVKGEYQRLDNDYLDLEWYGTVHQNKQIDEMKKKEKSLEDQLEEANKKTQEVEEKKVLEYEEMIDELVVKTMENDALKLRLDAYEKYIKNMDESYKKIQEAEEKKNLAYEKVIDKMENGEIKEMNSEILKLQETIDTLKKYNPQEKIEEMEKKEKSLEGDLELANAKIQEQTAQIKKLEEKKNDLMNEPSSYKRSNRSLLSSSSSSFMDSMYLGSYGLPYSGISQKERDEKKKEEDMEMESLCQKMKSEENFRFSSRQQYDRYNRWMAVQERNHNWEEQEIQFLEQDNQYLNEDIEKNNQKIQMLKK